jgi:nucleotide-binding universal stress UspA family protein
VHSRPVIVITVSNLMEYAVPFPPARETQEVIDLANKAVLDEALTQVYGSTEPEGVTRVVREGNPAQVLIDASQDASLLVVGARGRGTFPLGSVSDRCVRHAMSPVVVVR